MSFKNHNNYWHTYIQSEPEVSTEVVILSVTMGVTDTYITDENPNYLNIQVFNSGSQEFQTLTEVVTPDLLMDLPVEDSRQSFVAKKLVLATGVPSNGTGGTGVSVDIATGTIETPILIPSDNLQDCYIAIDKLEDAVKNAQGELAACLGNSTNPEDDAYKKYLDCRQQCKDQVNADLAAWLSECNQVGPGDESPTIPTRICVDGQPIWNWHSAISQACKDSFCEIVKKYVRCIGGEDICRYNPCTGTSKDPLGGDGDDNGIPPSGAATQSECWRNNPDANPTGDDTGIFSPDDEIAGTACWTAYYRKIFAAQCRAGIVCKEKGVYDNYCCAGFMFDTNDYCKSLGCVPSRGTDKYPIWTCEPEKKILCLQRKLENIKKRQACINQSPEANEKGLKSWEAHTAYRACVELAKAIWERDFGNATTEEQRKQAEIDYEANVAECLKQFEKDRG